MKKRKMKFGKVSGKKLSALEDKLAEVEQNLEREQMRRQGSKMKKLEGKMLVGKRESVEGHWERMMHCRGEMMTNMSWVTSEMLESASLDDEKMGERVEAR